MRRLLNTLFVLTEDSYLTLDGENIVILFSQWAFFGAGVRRIAGKRAPPPEAVPRGGRSLRKLSAGAGVSHRQGV